MLGRKTFTQAELDAAAQAVGDQLAALRRVADAVGPTADLGALEARFAETALMAFDRRFVHRIRAVTGKAGTPLNELELIVAALTDHDGELTTNAVIRYSAAGAVLHIEPGTRVELTADDAERLAAAALGELREKFLDPAA